MKEPLAPYYDPHYRDEYFKTLYAAFMTNPYQFNWKNNQTAFKQGNEFLQKSFEDLNKGEIMRTEYDPEYGTKAGTYQRQGKDNKITFTGDDGSTSQYGTSGQGKSTSFLDNIKANAGYLGHIGLGLSQTFANNNQLRQEQKYNNERYQRMMNDQYLPSSYNPYEYNPSGYNQTGDEVGNTDLWGGHIPDNFYGDTDNNTDTFFADRKEEIANENEYMMQRILGDMNRREENHYDDLETNYFIPNPNYKDMNINIGGDVLNKGKQARDYLISKGLDKDSAAAIVGNLIQESQLKTHVIGDGGKSFGIAQWNGERLRNLHGFAQSKGVDPTDLFTQLDFLLSEQRRGFDLNTLKSLPSIEEKTQYFSDRFESPSVPMINNRIGYAKKILNL